MVYGHENPPSTARTAMKTCVGRAIQRSLANPMQIWWAPKVTLLAAASLGSGKSLRLSSRQLLIHPFDVVEQRSACVQIFRRK